MAWNRAIKWIMLVCGVLTLTMVYAAVAPEAALRSIFGDSMDGGAIFEVVVRSWGALIALIGAMLVYGAFHPEVRPLVLVATAASKLVFITLIMVFGRQYLATAGPVVGIDLVMVGIFAAYLLRSRQHAQLPAATAT